LFLPPTCFDNFFLCPYNPDRSTFPQFIPPLKKPGKCRASSVEPIPNTPQPKGNQIHKFKIKTLTIPDPNQQDASMLESLLFFIETKHNRMEDRKTNPAL
jgi:hypothetical protein